MGIKARGVEEKSATGGVSCNPEESVLRCGFRLPEKCVDHLY